MTSGDSDTSGSGRRPCSTWWTMFMMYLTFISSLHFYFSCTLGQLLISSPGALRKTPPWLPCLWFCVANASSTTCPPVGTLSPSYCLGIFLLKDLYSPSTVWIRSGRCPGWHPVCLRTARWTCVMLSCLSASFTHVCNPVLLPSKLILPSKLTSLTNNSQPSGISSSSKPCNF